MATHNIEALNWHIHYIDFLESEQPTFIDICHFIINEFRDFDTIKIENAKRTISIHFPVAYSYSEILRKMENFRHQILINIDYESENKYEVSSSI